MNDISPNLFIDALLGYQKTAALKAALELDLFGTIADGNGAPEAIAARVNASPRGIRILCDYLTVQGFLEKNGGSYGLMPSTAAFLTRSSPAWMGSVAEFLAAPEMVTLWLDDPAGFVRNGGSVGLGSLAPDHPLWVTFATAMTPFMSPVASALVAEAAGWPAAPKRILDVAAGHGIFGISLAKTIPEAEVTALDWIPVLVVAQENAVAAGLAGRYRTLPGSAFEVDWGGGYDLVLLTNFLHHFDRETCIGLLRKAGASLEAEGRVLAVEFVPNDDRVSPPFPATFAFMMLGSTPKGDAYTAREFEEMGRAAGFANVTVVPVPPTAQSFVTFSRNP